MLEFLDSVLDPGYVVNAEALPHHRTPDRAAQSLLRPLTGRWTYSQAWASRGSDAAQAS
jgi:hypothetical protein